MIALAIARTLPELRPDVVAQAMHVATELLSVPQVVVQPLPQLAPEFCPIVHKVRPVRLPRHHERWNDKYRDKRQRHDDALAHESSLALDGCHVWLVARDAKIPDRPKKQRSRP